MLETPAVRHPAQSTSFVAPYQATVWRRKQCKVLRCTAIHMCLLHLPTRCAGHARHCCIAANQGLPVLVPCPLASTPACHHSRTTHVNVLISCYTKRSVQPNAALQLAHLPLPLNA